MRHRRQLAGRPDDRDIAVLIGAKQWHAEPSHLGEQQRRRMPVIVVGADAHHRDLGMHGGEKVWIEIRGTVMRHLQHVGTQVGAGRHQIPLRLDLGITRQQDPDAVHLGTKDE